MVSRIVRAVFVLSLIAGAARAQTATCPPPPRPVVPDAVPYTDYGDRPLFTDVTHNALVVIRKAAPLPPSDNAVVLQPLYVAFGVDVGNRAINFQITFSTEAELAAFTARLNSLMGRLAQENSVQDSPFAWGISSNTGHQIPPPPPGGPNGLPYAEVLGTRLVEMGTSFTTTANLALNAD